MNKKKLTKIDLERAIIDKRKEMIGNNILEPALIDLLVPLSGADGKIKEIDDDGNITIEFTAPISLYLQQLSRKKLQALVDMIDELIP